MELAHGLQRLRSDPGLVGARQRLPQRESVRVGERHEPCDRRVADAASRPVGDAHQRNGVRRVVDHLEVRDQVLDLGALVEARPADHLVRDALAHEHVLEHARLRVHPVEDRDLAAGEAFLDEHRDARGDEARLGVLVLDLDRLDRPPSPSSEKRFFGLRSRLFSMTAFAARRIEFVER